jgi:hypothetical protein
MNIIKNKKLKIFLVFLTIILIFIIGFYFYEYVQDVFLLKSYKDLNKGSIDDNDELLFKREIPFFTAYNQGKKTNYWYVGETKNNLNNIYYFKDYKNRIFSKQNPIVSALPNSPNYSGLWKIVYVRVPKGYRANDVKSVDTVLKAVEDKVFTILATNKGVNMPIVYHDVEIYNKKKNYPLTQKGWYDGYKLTLLQFEKDLMIDSTGKLLILPLITIYRDGQSNPAFELLANKDLNMDGDLYDSFNLMDKKLKTANYSPLAQLNYIHTHKDYPSLKSNNPPWTSLDDLVTNKGEFINFDKGKAGLEETGIILNIPMIP